MRRTALLIPVVALALFGLSACGSDDGSAVRSASGSASGSGSGSVASDAKCEPVGDPDAADTTVKVALDEWSVKVDPDAVEAGTVAFDASDVGEDVHELVIVKGVAPGKLPLDDDGALDEDELPRGALIGEIEGFPAGDDCTGVFALGVGDYTLLCNLVEHEDGKTEVHLKQGMVTTFTVTKPAA